MADRGERFQDPAINAGEPFHTVESPWGFPEWLDLFFPPRASTVAGEIDGMYLFAVAVSLLVSLAIAAFIVFFCWRYYRSRRVDRSNAPTTSLLLEIGWILLPLSFSVVIFIWASKVYFRIYTPPADTQDVYVVGKQWMWKIQHPAGPREIDELHVPAGQAIRLVITSQDVIHSFYIPAFRIKRDAVPGRYTTAWFRATRPGRYHLFCAEYCGTRHSKMTGEVVVMEPARYQEWLARGAAAEQGEAGTLAEQGEDLFSALGCSGCHSPGSPIRAPELDGLFGEPVPLQEGGFAIADEEYIRESIYFPQRRIVRGFAPVMPSYRGQVDEVEMLALVEYVRSLGGEQAATAAQQGGAAAVPNVETEEEP